VRPIDGISPGIVQSRCCSKFRLRHSADPATYHVTSLKTSHRCFFLIQPSMSTTRTRTAKPDSSAVQSVAGKRKRVVSDTKTKTKSKPETEDEARPTKRGKEDAPKPKPKAIPLAKRTQPTAKSPTQRETGAGTDHRVRKADLATSLLQPASHPRPSRQVKSHSCLCRATRS
jgi:hypothetical protein